MAAADVPYFTLNNGRKMPGVGKGCVVCRVCAGRGADGTRVCARCWLGPEGGLEVVEEMTKNALKVGYRHIDTVRAVSTFFIVQSAQLHPLGGWIL